MSLANLADLEPPPGKTAAVWLTRFQAKSVLPSGAEAYRIFYVGAKSARGAKPTFFAGSGDEPTGCISGSSGCKILTYPAERLLTSGTVSGDTITIDVSLTQGFGSTPQRRVDGPTLYSVTALSYGQNADSDIYLEGDATHSFDFGLGGLPPSAPQPASVRGGSGAAGGAGAGAGRGVGTAGTSATQKRFVRGVGGVGSARFQIDLSKGHARKLVFVDARRHVTFRSLRVATLRFGKNAARLSGTGVLNRRRVRFAAVAVDHGARKDIFRISWAGGASRGGLVVKGGLTVR
jgi:hypothetical protein